MHIALQSKRLWLLVSTLLVLVQPAAWAEGHIRKVGILSIASVNPASPSPLLKLVMETVRAAVPGQNVAFELRSADGKADRYPQILTELVEQHVEVILAFPGPAAVAAQ